VVVKGSRCKKWEVNNAGNSALLLATKYGKLETVNWLLREGGADVEDVNNDGDSAFRGQLETVRWLLEEGGADIEDTNNDGNSALISGQLETVKWLLKEGGSSIGEGHDGWTSLLVATDCGELATVQYLLEHGGADIGDTNNNGDTIWDLLEDYLVEDGRGPEDYDEVKPYVFDATVVTSLLRVMVLRGAPPAELRARLSPVHAQVAEDGARLKAGLPA
jgi:cellobiose-specific phosphotransferase system component IIA